MTVAMSPVYPAVIIANVRTGGTFLSHCLSNHHDVFCAREEIMHSRGIWMQTLRNVDRLDLLHCMLHQPHYRVSMVKLTYSQAFKDPIWPYLVKLQPKVIWLRRENALRQAVSVILIKLGNKGAINHPSHATQKVAAARVTLEPRIVINHAHGLLKREARVAHRFDVMADVLPVTYAEIVGGEGRTASELPAEAGQRICAFLDIPYCRMPGGLRRVNPQPLREIIENWSEVRAAIAADCELARFLEKEL